VLMVGRRPRNYTFGARLNDTIMFTIAAFCSIGRERVCYFEHLLLLLGRAVKIETRIGECQSLGLGSVKTTSH
jgi:hypothetical protein